jgi:DNA helicase-2/ATP-dependent DNA helicase PcrA
MAGQEEVATLGAFLETASLTQDVDSLEEDSGAVTLMTLHSAKGLEFDDVYLVGVEQNLIPHERSVRENDRQPLEEERRLLFVGVTRAKERLVLTQTQRREMHGRTLSTINSDFAIELIAERRDFTGSVSLEYEEMDVVDPYARNPYDTFVTGDDAMIEHERVIDRGRSKSAKAKKRRSDRQPHLTTGAALETGSGERASLPIGFSTGMQVRHPRYGLGTVIEVSGFSRMRTVTVEFDTDNRRESFVAAKCPLQPVGLR